MKRRTGLLRTLLCALASLGLSGQTRGETVSASWNDMPLLADWHPASIPVSAMPAVLLVHGGLAHGGMPVLAALQERFDEAGVSSLAVTLSLGVPNRHGFLDCALTHRHRQDDALDEIAVWLQWLRARGVNRVVLLGHSRGGGQVALFVATRQHPLVRGVVLLAPATVANSDAASFEKRYGQPLKPSLSEAAALQRSGRGESLLSVPGLLSCRSAVASADSFLSYYGDPRRFDTPDLLGALTSPALLVVAGADAIVPDLPERLQTTVVNSHLTVATVSGSDHFFRDLHGDDAADLIIAFLRAHFGHRPTPTTEE